MSAAREAWLAVEEDIRSRLLSTPEVAEDPDQWPEHLFTAEECPRCATYRCAGLRVPECRHWLTMLACCEMGEHSTCQDWWCDFAKDWRPRIVERGLPSTTPERPYVVVSLDSSSRDGMRVGGTYADHRQGKPARTRAGGGHTRAEGWAHKSRAWLVCGRCEGLHGV